MKFHIKEKLIPFPTEPFYQGWWCLLGFLGSNAYIPGFQDHHLVLHSHVLPGGCSGLSWCRLWTKGISSCYINILFKLFKPLCCGPVGRSMALWCCLAVLSTFRGLWLQIMYCKIKIIGIFDLPVNFFSWSTVQDMGLLSVLITSYCLLKTNWSVM